MMYNNFCERLERTHAVTLRTSRSNAVAVDDGKDGKAKKKEVHRMSAGWPPEAAEAAPAGSRPRVREAAARRKGTFF